MKLSKDIVEQISRDIAARLPKDLARHMPYQPRHSVWFYVSIVTGLLGLAAGAWYAWKRYGTGCECGPDHPECCKDQTDIASVNNSQETLN